MTLGILLPIVTAAMAVMEIFIFRRLRSKIPTRTQRDYEQSGDQKRTGLNVFMWASALTPVFLYVVLNFVVPEIGAIEVL